MKLFHERFLPGEARGAMACLMAQGHAAMDYSTLRIPGTLGQARRSWPARGMATQVVGPGSVQLVEDTTLVEPPVPGRADWRVVSAAWAREGPPPPGAAGFQRVCLDERTWLSPTSTLHGAA